MPRHLATTLAIALLLASCAANTEPASPTADADLAIVLDDILFEPDAIEVPAGEPVTVELTNDGGIVHDLVFDDGWETGDIRPGESAAFELPAFEADTIGWCSIPGHRDAGMELEVVVTDG